MILTGWTLIIVLVMDTIMVNKTGSYDDIIFNIQLNFDTNHQPPTLSLVISSHLSFYLHSMRGRIQTWNLFIATLRISLPSI